MDPLNLDPFRSGSRMVASKQKAIRSGMNTSSVQTCEGNLLVCNEVQQLRGLQNGRKIDPHLESHSLQSKRPNK